jgi:hypothetical protein
MKTLSNINRISLTALCLAGFYSASAGQPVQSTSFADIKEACQNPAKFHNQMAPTDIQISCRDVQLKWVPDTDGAVSMQTGHTVTASVISDKYSVSPMTAQVASSAQTVGCGRFKQVSESIDTVRGVTCAEIIAFNGGAIDFCAAAAASLKQANGKAVQVEDTGHTVNLCENAKEGTPVADQGMK